MRFRPAVILCLATLCSPAALAQQGRMPERRLPPDDALRGVDVAPELRQLAGALATDDYGVREAAMDTILALQPGIDTLCALLLDESLPTESRYRLIAVLRERVLNTPRGAVGIEADQLRLTRDEIVVARVLEDMPAANLLRPGDRITALNGESLRSWNAFVEQIQLHLPGEVVHLAIERTTPDDGAVRRLLVDVPLASAEESIGPDGQPQIRNALAAVRASIVKQAEYRFGVVPKPVIDAQDP